jgi:hypothetical protein
MRGAAKTLGEPALEPSYPLDTQSPTQRAQENVFATPPPAYPAYYCGIIVQQKLRQY